MGPPGPGPAYPVGGSWLAAAKSALTKFFRSDFPKALFPLQRPYRHFLFSRSKFFACPGRKKFPGAFFLRILEIWYI